MYLLFKLILSAGIVVIVSEVARVSPRLGGLIASLPLVSMLAMIWLYVDTQDTQAIAGLSREIFWLVLPSLLLFLALPWLLRLGLQFYAALSIASLMTIGAYGGTLWLLAHFSTGSGAGS